MAGTSAAAEDTGDADWLANYPLMETGNQRPAIDFAGVQADLAGEPTRILVLGTQHLRQLPEEEFSPADLALVLERLADFAPDVIAIEAIGGRTCDQLRRYEALYNGTAEQYCWDPAPVLESLAMSQPEAYAAAQAALSNWPKEASAEYRRRLAALLFGAGEPWSAALQWSYLTAGDRIQDQHVNEYLLDWLNKVQESRNENNLIGVALAGKLGLQQLVAMDDHSADIMQRRAPESLGEVLQQVWQKDVPGVADLHAEARTLIDSPERLLAGYRLVNSERYQRYVIAKDFGAASAAPDENNAARHYVAWWQVRGLRMAANVLEAAGDQPGARVLVIVGASHKAYFDAYLDMLHDVELVSADTVLEP